VGIGVSAPDANLHVEGNVYVSSNLTVSGNVVAGYLYGDGSNISGISSTLQAITDSGPGANVTSNTVQFSNAITSLTAVSNIVVTGNVTAGYFVGDGTGITGIASNLDQIVNIGNVTSNTVQFSNATTGFVTTANVEVGGELTVSGNVAIDTDTLFIDSVNDRVGIGTTTPTELLDIAAEPGDYDAFIRLRSGSGGTSPVTESGLKLTESGEYGFQFVHSGATDLLKIRHQNSAGNVDLDNIMVWKPNGDVGIGTSPGAKLHIGAFDNNHLLLTSYNNDYGWKIDTDDQGSGEVPFRLYRRTNAVDTLALSVANQNSRVNHTHTEKYNFHYNAATWSLATNVYSTATNLMNTTINFPYDGYIFVKAQGHWARHNSSNNGHVGGNQSFYAWISLNNQESAWSGHYDNHTGTDTNSYDKFHSYQSPDASGAGSWRNFHYSNFYKVSAGNNTLSIRVNNYFGSSHYLAINGAGISGFYVPKNYL
jgi:hypothetical protein